MSKAADLADRAREFEKRAETAINASSRHHYREMAAHYRVLSVEHLEAEQLQKRPPAESGRQPGRSSTPSFHNADRPAYIRAMTVGMVLCVAFTVISFSLRPQPGNDRVLVKADRLVRTAGELPKSR
jgi:hypothetical protein